MTKKLTEALRESRQSFIDLLEQNKEQWTIGERDPINGMTPVRICYETRNDGNIPLMTVLMSEKRGEQITTDEVADLLYEEVVTNNRSMDISVNKLIDSVSSGKSVVNSEMMEAILTYSAPLKQYRDKVLKNPRVMPFTIECELVEKGYAPDKLFGLGESFATLGRKALLLNTNEDGECPLQTTKHITDHILTTRFREKMEKEGEVYIQMLDKIESAKNEEPKKKARRTFRR